MPTRTRRILVLLAGLALPVLGPALDARAQTATAPSTGEPGIGVPVAPVEIDGALLFEVRGVSAYPARVRAAEIAARIREAARDRTFDPADLRVEERDGMLQILAGDTPLVAALDADARLEGVSRAELARAYLSVVRKAIGEYRSARQGDRLLVGAARATLATVILVLFVYLVRLAFRGLDSVIVRRFRRRIDALEARSFEIVRAERIRGLIRGTLRTLRAALLVAGAYYYLQRTLALFPWTRPAAIHLAAWTIGPLLSMWHAFVADIPDLIFLAVLGVVVRYGLRALRLFFDGIGRGAIRFEGFDPEWAAPTYKIMRIGAIAFAVVVAYPYIPGSGSDAFKGVSLFVGVVFSLGSSSVISNMIAGLAMTYRRTFKVGDRVKIGEVTGDVTAVRLQVTHLRTPKNEEVVVPNSIILNSHVTNYSTVARTQGLILYTTVGIGYEVPWRQVEAMLRLAAERTPGLERDPAPFVLQRSLGDFAVNYELNVYCRDPQAMAQLYAALHQRIQDVFNEYGVQIMTPNYEADTAQPKVVPKDQWYAAPAVPANPSGGDETTPSK
jgi:small-conductance mechanosensitive channel